MTLNNLKTLIVDGILPDDLIILECENKNYYLAHQYAVEIAKTKHLVMNYLDSLSSIIVSKKSALSLVLNNDNYLNILLTDTLAVLELDPMDLANTIIICDKVDKKLEQSVAAYIIKVSEPLEWQVKEYIDLICPELLEDSNSSNSSYNRKDWLYSACEGNIYKIMNELDKVIAFKPAERLAIFDDLRNAANTDLYTLNPTADIAKRNKEIFELVEFIYTEDKQAIYEFLLHGNKYKFDPIAIANVLLDKYKHTLLLSSPKITAQDLGISDKQFYWLKRNCKKIPEPLIKAKIDFLASIDLKLKLNKLDLDDTDKLSYIICNLLAVR